jgi:hypothetical protein
MRTAARSLLAATALLAALVPASRADTLRLENGRSLHGTVDRGYVDPDCVRIQLFHTGGVVKVRWEHLIAEDREGWQVDLGLRESDEAVQLKVEAHKITFLNATSIIAKILNPEALNGPASGEVRVMRKGKEETYARGQIAAVAPVLADIELIYTPRQAYEIKRDQINPNNGPTHFDLAEYAKAVRAYDESKEHLLEAKKDGDFVKTPQGKSIDSRLATLEILLRNRALQGDLDRVKVALIDAKSASSFGRAASVYLDAREAMYRIMDQYKDPKIQAEFKIADLAKRVETERRVFFEKKMPMEVYAWLRRKAAEKAGEAKVKDIPPNTDRAQIAILQAKGTFEGARQYFTRQVTEDLVNYLVGLVGAGEKLAEIQKIMDKDPAKLTDADKVRATNLAKMDKDLRNELVNKFWKDRSKTGGYTTSYGQGSFIVVKSDLKLTRKQPAGGNQGGRGGNRQGAGGGAQQQAVDVIRTPDQWWDESKSAERVGWLLSWYAEKGGFLEVVRAGPENAVNCDNCGGLGYNKINAASTGEEEAKRCPSCNGCKVVQKVRWR